MAYTINKTSGTILTTVADGTLDTTTDITLIGKNFPGYGETLNENFVRLLENFANSASPTSPIAGQLWWDTTNNLLKVYTGTSFKNIGTSTASASSPSSAVVGDLWWDTVNEQLKAYSGTSWVVIGPQFTGLAGTSGSIVEFVTDSLAVSHTIVSLYTANTRVAIISKDATFTPSPAISGFTTISPGINLASAGVIPNNAFTGLATNANTLDGLDSLDFMRSTANTSTTGTLAVNNNNGLTVGVSGDAKISVSGSTAFFENQTNGGTYVIRVRDSGGTQTNAITVNNNGNITIARSLSVNGNITLGDAITDGISFTGRVNTSVLPTTNNTYDLGSSSLKWSTIYATTGDLVAVAAEYADLAERYEADNVYVSGTVVKIGGDKEVTLAYSNDEIFGVISTDPAVLMNKSAGTNETHPAIALIGRVPVRVKGKVTKGQKLIVGEPGVAVAANGPVDRDLVIGKALENKYTEEESLIEVTLSSH